MKKLLPLLTFAIVLFSCSNSEKLDPIEESKISLDSIAMSFELEGKVIEMNSPDTRNSGWGTNVRSLNEGENIAEIGFHQSYRSDDYKVTLTFSKIINGNSNNINFLDFSLFNIPLDLYKKEVYMNNQFHMKYTDYTYEIYNQLELQHFYGFTVEIHDVKNDIYYSSKVNTDKVTADENSIYSPTKHLQDSYASIIKVEQLDILNIKEGISHAHGSFLTEVAFQSNMIKYTKNILGEINYIGAVPITDGKIIGLF